MRNLKRALSLALATVMTLGLMVVGTGATGYSDVTSEDNQEAIEVLWVVDIMTCVTNDEFDPAGLLRMIRCGGVAPRDYPSYFTALAASHFASRGKEPFKGEIFRFIFPLKILLFSDRAHPRKLQITRLALKRKIRSCRYSSPPTEITCAGFPLGSCFGHPYWM